MTHIIWVVLDIITINDHTVEFKWKTLGFYIIYIKFPPNNKTTYTAYTPRKDVFVDYSQKLYYLKYLLNFVQLTWHWKNRNTFDRKNVNRWCAWDMNTTSPSTQPHNTRIHKAIYRTGKERSFFFFLMVYCFEVLSSTYRVYKLFRQPIYNSTSWIFSMWV
jgi:hypothetical protein